MNITSITSTIGSARKGSIHTFSIEKTIKLKGGGVATKRTTMQGQVSVNYANLKDVKAGIESGEREAPIAPSWAESVEIDGVRMIRHKGSGKLFLPIAPTGNKGKSEYLVAGVKVDPATLPLYAKDKPRQNSEKLAWATIAAENIQKIK